MGVGEKGFSHTLVVPPVGRNDQDVTKVENYIVKLRPGMTRAQLTLEITLPVTGGNYCGAQRLEHYMNHLEHYIKFAPCSAIVKYRNRLIPSQDNPKRYLGVSISRKIFSEFPLSDLVKKSQSF